MPIFRHWKRLERIRRARLEWWGFAGSLILLALILGACNGLGRADWLMTDLATRLDTHEPSGQVVIIAIDDASIGELGRWPWPRGLHARLLDRLHAAGVRAVGMDVVFSEADASDPGGDRLLAAALVRDAPVVLPMMAYALPGSPRVDVLLPAGELARSAARLGHIHLDVDADGVARHVYLREGRTGPGGGAWDHMALAMWRLGVPAHGGASIAAARSASGEQLDLAQSTPSEEQPTSGWLRDARQPVAFAGPPGTLPRYSYADVLAGRVPRSAFENRYVLVGATATGLGDAYATPMDGARFLMPGVEIVGQVLDGLVTGTVRRDATWWENALYNLWPVLLALWLLYRGRPRMALAGMVILMIVDLLGVLWLRRWGHVQVAPVASLLCLALAYPWWSWRRLEVAMQHITDQFARMRRNNGYFRAQRGSGGDQLERDLRDFETAALQLDALQRLVRQSLEELPDAMLITDQDGHVLLANAAAHQLFRVYPPLPTLAFSPVYDDSATAIGEPPVAWHSLRPLLVGQFPLSSQSPRESEEGPSLEGFLAGQCPKPAEGQVELSDDAGGSYLLKVVPHGVSISISGESSQGWLVSLVNLSVRRTAEIQRDEALRFLEGPLRTEVAALDRPAINGDAVQTNMLLKLLDAYTRFARARSGVMQLMPQEVGPMLEEAMSDAAHMSGWSAGRIICTAGSMEVDRHMLVAPLVGVLLLLAKGAGGTRLPDIQADERSVPGAGFVTRIELRVASESARALDAMAWLAESSSADTPRSRMADSLTWAGLRTVVMRHGGVCRFEVRAAALVVLIEIQARARTEHASTVPEQTTPHAA